MRRAWKPAVAVSIAAIAWLASARPAASAPPKLDPKYLEILHRYARGERAQAIAALGEWSDGSLQKQVGIVESLLVAAERCPKCPSSLAEVPLRAAVMLHADRDKAEKPEPVGREETPRCPGPQSTIANRYAALLARDGATRDFARRFFLTTALLWQHRACFDDALAEARAGIELFPRDAELYLTAGCVLEEHAVLTTRSVPRDVPGVQKDWFTPNVPRNPPELKLWLEEARDNFADAVARDPELVLARVRLGRVLWRLGQPEAASEALAAALSRAHDTWDLYLTHLFLGRVHEDARRLDLALAEYRRAKDVDPETQSAAVAEAHVLQLLGEAEESRRALTRGLTDGRWKPDAYSDYLAGNTANAERMEAALHRESLE